MPNSSCASTYRVTAAPAAPSNPRIYTTSLFIRAPYHSCIAASPTVDNPAAPPLRNIASRGQADPSSERPSAQCLRAFCAGLTQGFGVSGPGYTPSRPQIDYPNGTVVYLTATSSASSTPAMPSAATTSVTHATSVSSAAPSSTPITTPAPTLSASSSPFLIDRQLWDKGPDILALQHFLNAHDFQLASSGPGSPGQESDFFGMKTYQALETFQKTNGLPATGYFGPLTRALINTRDQ